MADQKRLEEICMELDSMTLFEIDEVLEEIYEISGHIKQSYNLKVIV